MIMKKCNKDTYKVPKSRYKFFFPISLFTLLILVVSTYAESVPGNDSAGSLRQKSEVRPYAYNSPWNLKIGSRPEYEVVSDFIVSSFTGVFGSNPKKYTLPVYVVTKETPLAPIIVSGTFSNVTGNGKKLLLQKHPVVSIPIPDGAAPAKGSDGQIILWNPVTGDEWGFWRIRRNMDSWTATNGYHYNTRWRGVPPTGFLSRGAGVPYLAGLIRPWEIKKGVIEHAIALGINSPNRLFIYPATKSDGDSLDELLPMGARLQLNPLLTESDFDRFGLDRTGKIIARALQEYGMIVIDGSGHPKIYAEYSGTAKWEASILNKNSVKKIPYTEFRVLKFNTPKKPVRPANVKIAASEDNIVLSWTGSPSAASFRINRMESGATSFKTIATGIIETNFTDTTVKKGKHYKYSITGVNYNGISIPSKNVSTVF